MHFDLTQGRQEDAEEFLGCVLDKLHEEMIAAKRAVSDVGKEGGEATPIDGGKEAESKSVGTEDDAVSGEVKGDDEWEQVGPKNKSTITRQVSRHRCSDPFGGWEGSKDFSPSPLWKLT